MSVPSIDTDVIVRLISGDDPIKREAAIALFARVRAGELTLAAPSTVIADAVFVLTSPKLYRLPRATVAAALATLVTLPGFRVDNKAEVLGALQVFAENRRLDFGDAMIVSSMAESGAHELYSFDHDFDRIPWITRLEP